MYTVAHPRNMVNVHAHTRPVERTNFKCVRQHGSTWTAHDTWQEQQLQIAARASRTPMSGPDYPEFSNEELGHGLLGQSPSSVCARQRREECMLNSVVSNADERPTTLRYVALRTTTEPRPPFAATVNAIERVRAFRLRRSINSP